jgi:small subunit ribosomal protein S24e
LQALYRAGVINISAGGEAVVENRRRRDGDDEYDERRLVVPDALNTNKDSMPLLTALISIAAQPKFAIRKDKQSFRTATDKVSNSIS